MASKAVFQSRELARWWRVVYAELAPTNETAKQQILACEVSYCIKTLFVAFMRTLFLEIQRQRVNEFSQIIQEPEFQSLALDEQKQMVCLVCWI